MPLLYAEDFAYTIHSNKTEVYLHEPILLSVDINQTNSKPILLFNFNIQKNPAYHIEQIDAKHDTTPHATKVHNLYLIYPLKKGDFSINFRLIKRSTNDDKVSYFFSGDRDDFKKLETLDINIPLKPLTIHTKALPKGTQVVGNYTLSYEIPKHTVDSYESIPIKILLKGEGYPPLIDNLFLLKDKNITLFQQKPLVEKYIVKNSITYKVTYTFALSSDKSFDIPKTTLRAFNPNMQRPYILNIPAQHFDIQSVNSQTLVDKVDSPKPLGTDFSWIKTLFSYLLVFFSGYLTASVLKSRKKSTEKNKNPLISKIQNTKDTKALLQLLMAQDSHRFVSCISDLEKALYQDGKIKLSKVKEEAIDLV